MLINQALEIEMILNIQLFIFIIFIKKIGISRSIKTLPEKKPDLYFKLNKVYHDVQIQMNDSDVILMLLQVIRIIGIKDSSQKLQQFAYKLYLKRKTQERKSELFICLDKLKQLNFKHNSNIDTFIINIKKIFNDQDNNMNLYDLIIHYIYDLGILLLETYNISFDLFIFYMLDTTNRIDQIEHYESIKSSIKNILHTIINNFKSSVL